MIADIEGGQLLIRELLLVAHVTSAVRFSEVEGGLDPLIRIVDADEIVVFDTSIATREFSSRGSIHFDQWRLDQSVLAVTWQPTGSTDVSALIGHTVPPRFIEIKLDAVNKLSIADFGQEDETLSAIPEIRPGRNMQFNVNELDNTLQLSAIADDRVKTDDCDSIDVLRQINRTTTQNGQMFLSGNACVRIEPKVDFFGDQTAAVRDGEMVLADDCKPCCDCVDYLNIYRAMELLSRRNQYQASLLGIYGDRFRDASGKFKKSLDELRSPLVFRVETASNCRVIASIQYRNQTASTIPGYPFRFVFESQVDGEWVVPPDINLDTQGNLTDGDTLELLDTFDIPRITANEAQLVIPNIAPGRAKEMTFGAIVPTSGEIRLRVSLPNDSTIGPLERIVVNPDTCGQ